MLPVGVPIPDPKRVRANFISEVTGETLGHVDLCQRAEPSSGMQIWDNAAGNAAGFDGATGACRSATAPAPLALTFDDPKYARVNVQIATSGSASITCGQPLVSCYSAGSSGGPGFVHGWSDQPAVTDAANSAPELRSTVLLPGNCGDAYFSVRTTACTLGLNARLEFQPREYGATGTPHSTVSVKAVVGGSTYNLAWNAAAQTWSTAAIALAPGAGALPVTIQWEQTDNKVGAATCTNKNNNPCKGTIAGTAQRTFAGDVERVGPARARPGRRRHEHVGRRRRAALLEHAHHLHARASSSRVGVTGSLALASPATRRSRCASCARRQPEPGDRLRPGASPSSRTSSPRAALPTYAAQHRPDLPVLDRVRHALRPGTASGRRRAPRSARSPPA